MFERSYLFIFTSFFCSLSLHSEEVWTSMMTCDFRYRRIDKIKLREVDHDFHSWCKSFSFVIWRKSVLEGMGQLMFGTRISVLSNVIMWNTIVSYFMCTSSSITIGSRKSCVLTIDLLSNWDRHFSILCDHVSWTQTRRLSSIDQLWLIERYLWMDGELSLLRSLLYSTRPSLFVITFLIEALMLSVFGKFFDIREFSNPIPRCKYSYIF